MAGTQLELDFTTGRPPETVFATFAEKVAPVQGHRWAMTTPATAAITRKVVAPWAVLLAGVAVLIMVAYQFAPSKSPIVWVIVLPLAVPVVFARETRTVTVSASAGSDSTVVTVTGPAGQTLDAALGSAIAELRAA